MRRLTWLRPQQAQRIVGYSVLLLIVATNASLILLVPFSMRRFWIVAALYATGTLATLFLLLHPRNQWLVANRSQVESSDSRRCVGLTFDDGPSCLLYTSPSPRD